MLTRLALLTCLFLPFTVQARLHFITPGTVKPPAIISKCHGELQYGKVTIQWKTYDADTTHFYVERSEDGKTFQQLTTAPIPSADGINYTYQDSLPLPTGFYRIRSVNTDTVYSDTIRLSSISGMPVIKITPLLFDALITVEVNSQIHEDLLIALTDSEGKGLSSRLVNTEKGINKIVFDDAISFLYAAEYTMSVTGIQYNFSQKLYKK